MPKRGGGFEPLFHLIVTCDAGLLHYHFAAGQNDKLGCRERCNGRRVADIFRCRP